MTRQEKKKIADPKIVTDAVDGTVRTWANLCGKEDAAELLQETLDEETEADQKLTELAENLVNPAAEEGHEEEEKTAVSSRK